MNYEVIILPIALEEMDEAYEWLLAQTPQHAPLWYNGLLDALFSLESSPARNPLAPESVESADEEIRQMLYGDKRHAYRILFSVRSNKVFVLHIIHAARNR